MGKLKSCKYCGETISKKAKMCPHCGGPNKNDNSLWIGFAVIVGVFWVVFFNISDTTTDTGGSEYFTKGQLNVRSYAGTGNDIVETLSPGERLTVLDSTNNWYKINKAGGFLSDEINGWVHQDYVYKYNRSDFNKWKTGYEEAKRKEYEENFAERDESEMAYIMCQDFVKDRLRSPSTAEFQSLFERETIKTGPRYKIDSYVDAENGFGAMVRNRFTCIVTQTSHESWKLNSLSID